MTTDRLFEYLLEVNQEAAKELISAYHKGNGNSKLVFPKLRAPEQIRVSEQELRFAFANLLENNSLNYLNLYYSVETPTEELYSFSNEKGNPRSASTDMSLYTKDISEFLELNSKCDNTPKEFYKLLNIEFKGHNPEETAFAKDIEKLLCENIHGAWCHIIENSNKATLNSIKNKLTKGIEILKGENFKEKRKCKPLFISFLILDKKVLISRKGKENDTIESIIDALEDIGSIIEALKDIKSNNFSYYEWLVNRY